MTGRTRRSAWRSICPIAWPASTTPKGTTEKRLTQIGADVVVTDGQVTATPPSWRPDLRQPADLVEEVLRLEGLEIIPSVLPLAPAGPRPEPDAEAAARDRKVAGAQRLRGDPANAVPARGCLRPVGAAGRRRAAVHDERDESVGSRPARNWPPLCCRDYWRPWGATCPAEPSIPRCSRSPRWSSRRRKPAPSNAFRPTVAPPQKRSRRSMRRCRISHSMSARC